MIAGSIFSPYIRRAAPPPSVSDTNTRLDACSGSVSDTNTRLDACSGSVSDTNTRLDACSGSVSDTNTRLDACSGSRLFIGSAGMFNYENLHTYVLVKRITVSNIG